MPAGSSKLFDVERSARHDVDVTVAHVEIHENAESVKAGPSAFIAPQLRRDGWSLSSGRPRAGPGGPTGLDETGLVARPQGNLMVRRRFFSAVTARSSRDNGEAVARG
jgi:hypothetical protein